MPSGQEPIPPQSLTLPSKEPRFLERLKTGRIFRNMKRSRMPALLEGEEHNDAPYVSMGLIPFVDLVQKWLNESFERYQSNVRKFSGLPALFQQLVRICPLGNGKIFAMSASDYVSGGGAACVQPAHRRLGMETHLRTELVLTARSMVIGQYKPAAVFRRSSKRGATGDTATLAR